MYSMQKTVCILKNIFCVCAAVVQYSPRMQSTKEIEEKLTAGKNLS